MLCAFGLLAVIHTVHGLFTLTSIPKASTQTSVVKVHAVGSMIKRVRGLVRESKTLKRYGMNIASDGTDGTGEPAVMMPLAVEDESMLSADLKYFAEVDKLHESKQFELILERLQCVVGTELDGPELQWRLARANCDLSDLTDSTKQREQYIRSGLAAAERAVALAPSVGYCQKWYGIMLGLVGDFESIKTKISNSHKIKAALDVAEAALPEDAIVKLALGQWCYKLSSIGPVGRKVAALIFGSTPEARYEDALHYLEESYRLKPTERAQRLIEKTKAKLQSR